MTLAEMTIQGQDLLNQTQGSEAERFGPFAWKRNLLDAADRIARATHCLYRTFSLDLVSGQSDYCAPPLYHIKAGSALGSDGVPRVLSPVKPRALVPRDLTAFLSGNDGPQSFAVLGAGTVRLYETPGYATTGATPAVPPAAQSPYGLVLEGFGTCAGLWDVPADECPLPTRAHIGVVYMAAARCAAQMRDFDAAKYYETLSAYESGLLEAESATITAPQSGRHGSPGAMALSALTAQVDYSCVLGAL